MAIKGTLKANGNEILLKQKQVEGLEEALANAGGGGSLYKHTYHVCSINDANEDMCEYVCIKFIIYSTKSSELTYDELSELYKYEKIFGWGINNSSMAQDISGEVSIAPTQIKLVGFCDSYEYVKTLSEAELPIYAKETIQFNKSDLTFYNTKIKKV